MKPVIALLVLLGAGLLLTAGGSAGAADLVLTPAPVHAGRLPFARSPRAQAVWAERTCWRACQSYCTWDFAACLRVASQGACLGHTDVCDRACQSDCRTRGGPLVQLGE